MSDTNTLEEALAAHVHLSNLFMEKFAERISPISSLEGALFGGTPPTPAQEVQVLEAAATSAVLLHMDGRHFEARRLANQAISQAVRLLNSEVAATYDQDALAQVIRDTAGSLAWVA